MGCCDVCVLSGFCSFLSENDITRMYPELYPYAACENDCQGLEDYFKIKNGELKRLKEGGSPLKHFSTADLVQELAWREGVESFIAHDDRHVYEIWMKKEPSMAYHVAKTKQKGPATILVVLGDQS